MSIVEKALVATDRCMSQVVKLGVDNQHALRGHVIVFGQEGAQMLYERRRVVPGIASVSEHIDVSKSSFFFFNTMLFIFVCFNIYFYATDFLSIYCKSYYDSIIIVVIQYYYYYY
jgi:hypothetical protein